MPAWRRVREPRHSCMRATRARLRRCPRGGRAIAASPLGQRLELSSATRDFRTTGRGDPDDAEPAGSSDRPATSTRIASCSRIAFAIVRLESSPASHCSMAPRGAIATTEAKRAARRRLGVLVQHASSVTAADALASSTNHVPDLRASRSPSPSSRVAIPRRSANGVDDPLRSRSTGCESVGDDRDRAGLGGLSPSYSYDASQPSSRLVTLESDARAARISAPFPNCRRRVSAPLEAAEH